MEQSDGKGLLYGQTFEPQDLNDESVMRQAGPREFWG